MRIVLRFVLFTTAVLAVVTPLSSSAIATTKPVGAPTSLRAFLLSPSEPVTHVFPRTPAFAWKPVRGATCYEFELATSRAFGENAIVWSNVRYGVKPGVGCASVPAKQPATTEVPAAATPGSATTADSSTSGAAAASTTPTTPAAGEDPAVTSVIEPLRVPAVSVDIALPWFTGQPYALYAHARAITANGPTAWSTPFAFNTRWPSVPTPLVSQPGLIRWTSVSGATGYQVWYPDIQKSFSTHTNVADEREFYTLKNWYATVHWRVRAVRRVFGDVPNGLPAVSYGPWSPVYTSTNPTPDVTPIATRMALSDGISDGTKQSAHALMPGLAFNGDAALDQHVYSVLPTLSNYPLYRVYAATDRDCVNIVFRSSIVGSPAYAPRTSGPLQLPLKEQIMSAIDSTGVLPDVPRGQAPTTKEWTTDWRPIVTNESQVTASTSSSGSGATGSGGSTASDPNAASGNPDESQTVVGATVDLPDIDFPTTRYYWTVVPVIWAEYPPDPTAKYGYWDVETPQDACAANRVESFGKESGPVVIGTGAGAPYVAGLKPDGRALSAREPSPDRVLDTPDRLGARCRRDRVRGSVVTHALSLAGARIEDDLLHLCGARSRGR